MYPIIIIGQPRSGTSNVARILHDYYGIFMGHKFWEPEFAGSQGTFEDMRLMEANSLFERGAIGIKPWIRRFRRFVRSREKLNLPWGFKDPRLLIVLGLALSFFKQPTIIRCHRDRGMVVKSQVKKLQWGKKESEKYYDHAESIMDKALKGRSYLLVDYPEGILHPDTKLIDSLSDIEFEYAN